MKTLIFFFPIPFSCCFFFFFLFFFIFSPFLLYRKFIFVLSSPFFHSPLEIKYVWEKTDHRWGRIGQDLNKGKSKMFSSVQFSCLAMSDPLRPHESQHARPPCPSPIPGVHSHSCPLSQRCHPAISSSVIPFSSCPQSLPASESFPMSQLFAWDGQSIGVSA